MLYDKSQGKIQYTIEFVCIAKGHIYGIIITSYLSVAFIKMQLKDLHYVKYLALFYNKHMRIEI